MLVAGREVKVTNLDKPFFPKMGLTKGDLIQYYVDVSDAVLHHVARRPMQMKRHPNGVEGDFFYQKRVPVPHPEWLETVHINYPSGNEADFPVVTDAAGLAWIANLGCIELHTWHSRVPEVNKPDYLLIDLDPSEGNPWAHVREIAMAGKRVMDDLGLPCYPKTSGVTGLHILIHARASAPLRWDEVAAVEPGDFTMVTMRERIKAVGDLTAGMWEKAVSLDPLFDTLKVKRTLPPRKSRSGPPRDWRAEYDAKKAGGSGWNRGTQRGPSHR